MNEVENEDAIAVTVYYGEGAYEEQAEQVAELFREKYPDAEVMCLEGGQPVYSYIISIE
jgi:dihydroxyacetone kinase-like predicted kinase